MIQMRRWLTRFFFHLFYRRLWVKIAPLILITVTVPIIALGFLLINTSQKAIRNSVLNNHEEIAVLAAGEISLFVKRSEDILNTTAAMLSVVYPAPWKQETILVELALNQPVFIRAATVNLNGEVISSSEMGRGLIWELPKDVLQEAENEKGYISEVKMLDTYTPYVTMAVPIKKMGRSVGTLIADASLRGVWDTVDKIRLGKTGAAFLVAKDGTLIAHQDKKLVLKKINISRRKDVQEALTYKKGAMEIKDESGGGLISSFAPIPGVDWGIVLQQAQSEAYSFSKVMQMQSRVIILLSEILAVLISIFIARFLTRPIKALALRIKSAADGDLERKMEIRMRDEIGELIRSFNDMTEKLKKAKEKTRLSAIGEAASWISHELKNSLMLIKSFMLSFPKEHSESSFINKFSRLMPLEISRWERMVNELSDLSSQEKLKITRVDVSGLLMDTLEVMSEKIKERKIKVEFVQQDNGLFTMADEQRLKQVFVNLIMNAINAMPEGGSLFVSAGLVRTQDTASPQDIEVKIRDTGIGIPGGIQEKIFEPFFTTSRQSSMGLGLTIARKIIEQHSGHIKVESKQGIGTTFIIALPQEPSLSSRQPMPA